METCLVGCIYGREVLQLVGGLLDALENFSMRYSDCSDKPTRIVAN